VCHQASLTLLVEWLTRAARLISAEAMSKQYVRLEQFRTEELGLAAAQSLAASK
jgi:hypothetical protein